MSHQSQREIYHRFYWVLLDHHKVFIVRLPFSFPVLSFINIVSSFSYLSFSLFFPVTYLKENKNSKHINNKKCSFSPTLSMYEFSPVVLSLS